MDASLFPFRGRRKPLTDKAIVLDIDETLVHTFESIIHLNTLGILDDPKLMDLRPRVYTVHLNDVMGNKGKGVLSSMWGVTRPHLREFLEFCFTYFKTVAIWSAGRKRYVESIRDYLFEDIADPHITYTYDNCVTTREWLTKPLLNMITNEPEMNRIMDLTNTFVIDDRDTTFMHNPGNGILIPAYKPCPTIKDIKKDDAALLKLKKWFLRPEVMGSKDVRTLPKYDIFR